MFTQQHYIVIAKMISKTKTRDELINELVYYFIKDNPKFNYEMFLKACLKEV